MQGFKLTTELFFGSQAINHLEGLTYRNALIITDGFLESSGMVAKTGLAAPIDLESNNGLRNLRYSVGMARSTAVKSATSQFYVNLRDNTGFDYVSESAPGYAVFGRIVSGTDVIDLIASKPTKQGTTVPVTDITITSATQTQ